MISRLSNGVDEYSRNNQNYYSGSPLIKGVPTHSTKL